MKRLFIALLLLIAAAPTVGMAQEVQVNASTATTTTAPEAAEAIDGNTAILSARFDEASGTVVLVLRSERPQMVTLTDAGGVFAGGEISTKEVRLLPGRNRVEISVTKVSGKVAVTIGTSDVLYGKTIRTGSNLITGPYGKTDVQTSALAGLAAGLGVTGLIAYRRVRGVSDDAERIL